MVSRVSSRVPIRAMEMKHVISIVLIIGLSVSGYGLYRQLSRGHIVYLPAEPERTKERERAPEIESETEVDCFSEDRVCA